MKKFIVIALAAVFMIGMAGLNLSAEEVSWKDAKKHMGKEITVCGKIVDAFPIGNGITLLGMGVSATQPATVGIEIPDKVKKDLPADLFKGKETCVTGKVHTNPLGGASITINKASDIKAK
ncbi:MAG: hypothetical protein JW864_06490 [Spirochaetes bacterium]|nr:hypothetical protein [Spirochaetota bacterium]